jgi:anti-sigma regulatory factor (Ser/Thr protein kinase)
MPLRGVGYRRHMEVRVEERYPPSPGSVGRARMLVRSAHQDLSSNSQEVVEVIVSELASNAVIHAATPFTVRLFVGSTIRVEVFDANPDPPVLRRPVSREAGGRGLVIVDGFADRWGSYPVEDGKAVWAEVDEPA